MGGFAITTAFGSDIGDHGVSVNYSGEGSCPFPGVMIQSVFTEKKEGYGLYTPWQQLLYTYYLNLF